MTKTRGSNQSRNPNNNKPKQAKLLLTRMLLSVGALVWQAKPPFLPASVIGLCQNIGELFNLLCENIDVPAPHSPPPPPSAGKKNMQKRKNLEPASVTGAPKRACGSSSSARSSHSTIQNNDPVLSALSSIQSSITAMNSRIQALESGSTSRNSENLLFSGPASLSAASTTLQ
ncbi:hypothetical protein M9458_052242 [Cirrhinus mrigala]|uniref:Uncharacterized protein n=1 Tax=Cirrhinus mrigala TaxID=683832 RepID=A0ABD0MR50_CIRMR